jgi:hypothetical protein
MMSRITSIQSRKAKIFSGEKIFRVDAGSLNERFCIDNNQGTHRVEGNSGILMVVFVLST